MVKESIEEIKKYVTQWQMDYGESFVEYFYDSVLKTEDVPIFIEYLFHKFSDLWLFIMDKSDGKIVWKGFLDYSHLTDSLLSLIYQYYNEDNNKEMNVWISAVHDIDSFYTEYIKWKEEQYIEDVYE